jgi:nucleoside-diphosphate-sugar epimerase
MKAAVIGGTGLISTAITRMALARGDAVTLFNRGKTPRRFGAGATMVTVDRNDEDAFLRAAAQNGPFDCVIDMICFTPEQARASVRAFSGRTKHFINCSTVNVYRRPADIYPIREDARREPLNDDYGTKKVECENVFLEAHARGDLAITNLRPAQTYGEGGVIIHTFGWSTTYLDRIRKGRPIVAHGDGTSLWVPCHVDDVARAFLGAACNERAYGRSYHVTGEEWLTWNRYHELVAQALNAPPPDLVHIPTDLLIRLAPGSAYITFNNFSGNNVFDNTAAKTDLGFRYTIPWVEGVRRTVAWLDANGGVANSDKDPLDDAIIGAFRRHSKLLVQELTGIDTSR